MKIILECDYNTNTMSEQNLSIDDIKTILSNTINGFAVKNIYIKHDSKNLLTKNNKGLKQGEKMIFD